MKEQGVRKQELRTTLSEVRGKEYHTSRAENNTTQAPPVTFDTNAENSSNDIHDDRFIVSPFQKRAVAYLRRLLFCLSAYAARKLMA